MDFEKLEQSLKNGVLTLVINNPPVNAMSSLVVAELRRALKLSQGRREVKEIVIRGAGEKYFSAGADINELKAVVESAKPFKAGYDFSIMGQELVMDILSYPKPVKAFINGFCFGGGFEIALACHSREIVRHARFGLSEATLGIIPGWGGLELLIFRFNVPKPRDAVNNIADGRKSRADVWFWHDISSRGARVFDKIIYSDLLLAEKDEISPRRTSSAALQVCFLLCDHAAWLAGLFKKKGAMSGEKWDINVSHVLASQFGIMCALPQAKEGINAFLEKRQPDFDQFEK